MREIAAMSALIPVELVSGVFFSVFFVIRA
jgi:hypothetical protein